MCKVLLNQSGKALVLKFAVRREVQAAIENYRLAAIASKAGPGINNG